MVDTTFSPWPASRPERQRALRQDRYLLRKNSVCGSDAPAFTGPTTVETLPAFVALYFDARRRANKPVPGLEAVQQAARRAGFRAGEVRARVIRDAWLAARAAG